MQHCHLIRPTLGGAHSLKQQTRPKNERVSPVAKAQARLPLTAGHALPGWKAADSLFQQTRLASKPFLNFDHRLNFACLGCRTYPVREGEVLSDIILKRNISREEMEALNPGVNLDKLTGGAAQACSIELPLSMSTGKVKLAVQSW